MMVTENTMNTRQIARLLDCRDATVDDLMRSGDLAATKLGRGWITTLGHVLGFLQAQNSATSPRERVNSPNSKPKTSTPTLAAHATKGAKAKPAKAKPEPVSAGAGADDGQSLPIDLAGGSMHPELKPQAAWPFRKPRPSGSAQTDDAAAS